MGYRVSRNQIIGTSVAILALLAIGAYALLPSSSSPADSKDTSGRIPSRDRESLSVISNTAGSLRHPDGPSSGPSASTHTLFPGVPQDATQEGPQTGISIMGSPGIYSNVTDRMLNPRKAEVPPQRKDTPSHSLPPKPEGRRLEKQGFRREEKSPFGLSSRFGWFGHLRPSASDLFAQLFMSPPPTLSFQALGDDGSGIPPDTDGAVGPNHLMVILNRQVGYQDKSGTLLFSESLPSFWSSIPGLTDVFDSKVLYDPNSGRFLLVTLANEQSANSKVLIGVSQTSSPLGGWWLYSIAVDATGNIWADYPSIGFNKDWIVIDTISYTVASNASSGSRVWAFNKANALAGSPLSSTQFKEPNIAWTLAPAETFSPTQSSVFLIGADSPANGTLELYSISGPVGSEVLSHVATVAGPSPWGVSAAGFADFAPQAGSPVLIDAGDERMQNVVYRNGSLWATHSIFLPAGAAPSRASIQWWQISPAGSVLQYGLIDDPTGTTFYAYPSIAVNANDDALIGYSTFSASQYPSAGYSFRYAQDPPNTLQSPTLLKAGEAPYVHKDTNNSNRWGDFSHSCIDPVNDMDFWTIQEYAASPPGTWGTWWGKLVIDTAPPSTPAAPDLLSASDTGTSNTDNLTSVMTPTFTGVIEVNATVKLYAGATLVGTATADASGLYFVTSSALASGVYNFTVTATDSAYNASGTSPPLSVTIDLTPPATSITAPTSGSTYDTSTSPLSLAGSSADTIAVATVTWVNAATGQAGGAAGTSSWTASIPLVSGSNVITVISWDTAGNPGLASLTVNYTPVDNVAPTLSITSSTSTAATPMAMAGTVSDNVGVTSVTWANLTTGTSGAAAGTPSWTASVPLSSGNNFVEVTAWDAAGNSAMAIVTLTLTSPADAVPPTVAITAPTSGPTTSTSISPIVLGGTASDNVGVSRVTWFNQTTGGTGVAAGTTSWSASVALVTGSNVITVTSQDVSGNISSAVLTATLNPAAGDSTHPFISIQSPTSAPTFRTASSSINLSGIAADDTGLSGVNWSNSLTAQSGSASGLAAWSAIVPLTPGYNAVTLTAIDTSGNATSATITVAYSRGGGGGGGGGGGCGFLGLEAGVALLLASQIRRWRKMYRLWTIAS